MTPLELVKLNPLMERSSGRPEIVVGLIDGPVVTKHPDLAGERIREIPGSPSGSCTHAGSLACMHGTFVAGVLSANRTSVAPAICPNCTLLVRPIFPETMTGNGHIPGTTPEKLAAAIFETIEAGAHVVNLSLALESPSHTGHRNLQDALDFAGSRGTILVSAAGNQGAIGGTTLTQHPAVTPVMAYNLEGRPLNLSNLGVSIGRHGLGAPGQEIVSLGPTEGTRIFSGTSAATPFVTGTIALLWSVFPSATTAQVKSAVTGTSLWGRKTVVPPLLDASLAYQNLESTQKRK